MLMSQLYYESCFFHQIHYVQMTYSVLPLYFSGWIYVHHQPVPQGLHRQERLPSSITAERSLLYRKNYVFFFFSVWTVYTFISIHYAYMLYIGTVILHYKIHFRVLHLTLRF